MLAYFVIAICQLDIKISLSLRAIGGKIALRYCLAGILIIGSFIIIVVAGRNTGASVFAVIFLLLALRIAGLISAEKFEEQIGKVVDKITPGSNKEEENKASEIENNETEELNEAPDSKGGRDV